MLCLRLTTYLTDFGPKVITARLLLEAECQVTRIILSPHNEGLLQGEREGGRERGMILDILDIHTNVNKTNLSDVINKITLEAAFADVT